MKYNTVIQWDELEVSAWLATRGYNTQLVERFVNLQVTGDILLQLSEKQIKHFLSNGILRKRLARDLRNLKKSLDYSNSDAELTANLLSSSSSSSSSDLVEHTHRLVSSGLSLENIELSDNISQRLEEAGIENNLHLVKIQALYERERNKLKGNVHITSDSKSQTLGSLVDIYLKLRGFQTTGGRESESLLHSDCLLVVLSNTDSLQASEDQIQAALHHGLTVILVVEEHLNLNQKDVSVNLEEVKVVRWIHDYQEAAIDRLEKIITTDTVKYLENSMKTRSISVDSGIDIC